MHNKTAIVLGATGLTGSLLLQELLQDDDYACVKIFARRSLQSMGIEHPKIQEFIGDITELQRFKEDFIGDEVFCCIGTTKAKTPDAELYHAIDVGIPTTAAKLAKTNGIGCFAVVSAMGADSNSRITYNRLKGEMEQGVQNANIPHTYILRPSLIFGDRFEKRFTEDVGNLLFKGLRPVMVRALKKYRPIAAQHIASALLVVAKQRPAGGVILSDDIERLATESDLI